jgi:ABC-2 type transport system permease protein
MNKLFDLKIPITSKITTLLAMAHKELLIMVRYPVEFIASFGQVFLIVVIFTLAGLTFSQTSQGSNDSITSGVVVYGFILFMFVGDTIWTLGYDVRREIIQGTLEQLYLSPASKFSSLISRVVIVLVWTGLLCVASVFLMVLLLGQLPFYNGLLGGYLLVMSLLGTFGMGFAFAAFALRFKEAAQPMAILLQFAFLIFCAIFFPFSSLPPTILIISRLIPFSYAVDAFRSTLMNYPEGFPELAPIEVEILIVTGFALVMPLIGYYLYRLAEKHARHRGGLSEY